MTRNKASNKVSFLLEGKFIKVMKGSKLLEAVELEPGDDVAQAITDLQEDYPESVAGMTDSEAETDQQGLLEGEGESTGKDENKDEKEEKDKMEGVKKPKYSFELEGNKIHVTRGRRLMESVELEPGDDIASAIAELQMDYPEDISAATGTEEDTNQQKDIDGLMEGRLRTTNKCVVVIHDTIIDADKLHDIVYPVTNPHGSTYLSTTGALELCKKAKAKSIVVLDDIDLSSYTEVKSALYQAINK